MRCECCRRTLPSRQAPRARRRLAVRRRARWTFRTTHGGDGERVQLRKTLTPAPGEKPSVLRKARSGKPLRSKSATAPAIFECHGRSCLPPNVPSPRPRRIAGDPNSPALAMSVSPSPSKSATTTLSGASPIWYLAATRNDPSPFPSRILTNLESNPAVAMSRLPSRLKSDNATLVELSIAKLRALTNVPSPLPSRTSTRSDAASTTSTVASRLRSPSPRSDAQQPMAVGGCTLRRPPRVPRSTVSVSVPAPRTSVTPSPLTSAASTVEAPARYTFRRKLPRPSLIRAHDRLRFPELPVMRSGALSPFRSAAAMSLPPRAARTATRRRKLPSPFPRSSEMERVPMSAVARSGLASALRSAATSSNGCEPVAATTGALNRGVPTSTALPSNGTTSPMPTDSPRTTPATARSSRLPGRCIGVPLTEPDRKPYLRAAVSTLVATRGKSRMGRCR